MKRHKTVITGMGVVSSLGCNVASLWRSLCHGVDGIGKISVCDLSDFTYQQGGQIVDIPGCGRIDDRLVSEDDRALRLLLPAVEEAWNQAGLADGREVAVVLGTNFGQVGSTEVDLGTDHGKLAGCVNFSPATDLVAEAFGCSGSGFSLSLSCSSGAAAIGYGMELIRSGRAVSVIAGGYDAVSRFAWAGLSVLRTMTQEKIRPFDQNRSGTLFAEGAGIVVLEELNHARARKADILAELAGFGFNNNAFHLTAPAREGAGLAAAMQMALDDADIEAGTVGHINTHGTGTRFNDVTETQAIKSVFADYSAALPITSVKSMTGHLMGAAGSVEAIVAVESIRNALIPPTINYQTPDPECDLPIVTGKPVDLPCPVVVSNSSGIGGNNVSLVISGNSD